VETCAFRAKRKFLAGFFGCYFDMDRKIIFLDPDPGSQSVADPDPKHYRSQAHTSWDKKNSCIRERKM